jgi:hypothetical protein
MSPKTWLAVYGISAALVVGGSGAFALTSYRKYTEAVAIWESKLGVIEALEKKTPYPNETNVLALAAKVESYKDSVAKFRAALQSFQRPLNPELANTSSQGGVRKRVENFRKAAKERGLELATGEDFLLGFDLYTNTLPSPDLVPLLEYQAEAIEHLLGMLVDSGADSLNAFERDPIPGEPGGAVNAETGWVRKYPVRLKFRASFDSFQQFMNALANDREFCYIVRVLKWKNEAPEGVVKSGADSGTAGRVAGLSPAEDGAHAEAEERDARVLMGQEKLDIFMVVDIVRFPGPDEKDSLNP